MEVILGYIASLVPFLGTKRLARGQHSLDSRILKVHRGRDNIISPPRRRVDIIQGKRKKDDERAQRKAQVEPRARQKVESAPPAEVALLDQELEQEAHDAPREIVERGGGRDRP